MALLTVENLSVTYRGHDSAFAAVKGVSFAIEPGEVFALVGESGSGKSSVALGITRLLPEPPAKVEGSVRLGALEVLTGSPEQLLALRGGKISYVFQDPATSLNPVLTIGEQVREAVELHTPARGAQADAKVAEWLSRVGIPKASERLDAYPHEFSGGMRQRVCIAMALAAEPELLVADEPTTALDVTIQVQILRLLRDLQRTLKLSVLLISHDLTVVERIAHRVGVMSKGELVETGPVAQVLHQPKHPYTQELIKYRKLTDIQRKS